MNFKKKLYLLIALVLVIVLAVLVFPASQRAINVYDQVVFYPFQWLRDVLLGYVPFSVGDMIYVAGGMYLLVLIVKWVRYCIHFKKNRDRLLGSLLNCANTVLFIYLFFILGWGANYYKDPLAKNWDLKRDTRDTLHLAAYDSVLVEQLNLLAPSYRDRPIGEVNALSRGNYEAFTDSRLTSFGLNIKTSTFSYFLQRTAIQGYYNPFTGEGQVSDREPGFMMPFVISHEMAHQAGIAAEGDANLMAYAVSTLSADSSFNYSAYLNIWLYVDRRLHRKDSMLAKKFESRLNKLTTRHIAILDSLSDLYDNDISHYSTEVFDGYLKMQQQKDGIKSYGSVVLNAWLLERRRSSGKEKRLHIP